MSSGGLQTPWEMVRPNSPSVYVHLHPACQQQQVGQNPAFHHPANAHRQLASTSGSHGLMSWPRACQRIRACQGTRSIGIGRGHTAIGPSPDLHELAGPLLHGNQRGVTPAGAVIRPLLTLGDGLMPGPASHCSLCVDHGCRSPVVSTRAWLFAQSSSLFHRSAL